MSVKQENRYRKLVILQGRELSDRQREIEAATMERKDRCQQAPLPAATRRRDVRAWMRRNADQYETATHLAEGANVIFRFPDDCLDDENHWVWDEAVEAIEYAERLGFFKEGN